MNEKESETAKSRRDSAARKGLFERAILAGWAPFSLGVIFFAALEIWALNLSPDEIVELKFWLPFIRGVRVFAPFLDDFANNSANLNVLAFYACAAPFWICFFAAVFCLNYGRADFGRVNLIVTGAKFLVLGGFCFLAFSGLLFAPERMGGRWGVYVRFDAYALANDSAPYNLAAALVIGAIFAAFGGVVCDLIYRLRSGRRE
ncbi:hypothetical protein [uncultured Campylobacter sp.]|uniref:hypothetical protein n=1 Tax=uncultured Campylobacter sp. TaxID=218934 RepID=UPI002623BF7A|nr:hypothetical protein [uncultured Campylobacter sp.]